MKQRIRVEPLEGDLYEVAVNDPTGASVHQVRVTESDRRKFGGDAGATTLLEESFRFLLEHEPKEAILSRFDLGLIEHHFPEYSTAIRERLA